MIINFDNLGGGGGGGYVLPVATDSRLGGVKVGSGLTITNEGVLSSNGGGTDPNAQHWFTAETKSAAESLTGLTEGDVVVIPAHNENVPAPDDFYNAISYWGWSFIEALNNTSVGFGFNINNGGNASIVFTKADNPYYDGESNPYECMVIFYYWDDSIGKYIVSGVGYSNDYGFVIAEDIESDDPSNIQFNEFDVWTADTFTMSFTDEHWYESSMFNQEQLFVFYGNTTNASATTLTGIEHKDSETVQLNNGSLINLASLEDVNSAMTRADRALSEASQKLPELDWINQPSWNDFGSWETGVYTNLYIDDVDEGTRLHKYGANSELTNPKFEEIMTNRNPGVVPATLRVVSLNQSEYDALVSGGTTSDNTLYIIVDDTKWQQI